MRSAHAGGRIDATAGTGGGLLLQCSGTNASGAALSRCQLAVTAAPDGSVEYILRSTLAITGGREWRVTPHPHHGELEFLNLFPAEVFLPPHGRRKRYDGCFVVRGERVERIPHHHLESTDKHDIALEAGDVFCYLLENENPAVELLAGAQVSAGVCAYMWDAHFAVRVCPDGRDVLLRAPRDFTIAVRVFSIDAGRGRELAAAAVDAPCPDLERAPLAVRGLNTFSESFEAMADDAAQRWPWSFESDDADADGTLDRSIGYSDSASLRIAQGTPAHSRWVASTFGPAFGGAAFPDRAVYRLSAWMRCSDTEGKARIALRLHREGCEGLFDPSTYEIFAAEIPLSGTCGWMQLAVETPCIAPRPDRLHLLLELEGRGDCHFDDVLFEEIAEA